MRLAAGVLSSILAVLALAAPARAVTVVSKSSFSEVITLDPVAQDHLKITTPTPGKLRVTDTAGVMQDPNNEAICDGVQPVDPVHPELGQYIDCSYGVGLSFVEVRSTVNKQLRDVVDASGSPVHLFLFRQPTVNEIEVTGTPFNDNLTGSGGADVISGGGGVDQISGGGGADALSGGADNDTLAGGDGDDVLMGGAGNDGLDGGANSDTASYADRTAAVTINLTDPGGDGAAGEADTLTTVENLVGGSGDDTLIGDAGANSIQGGDGRDIVIGGDGPDRLDAGPGDDDVRARDVTTDTVDCGAGTDTAQLDDIDLAANCDGATITVVDVDGDGAPAAGGLDCNDRDPSIHAGAIDIPGDGIDQDCSGADAKVDADGDGFTVDQDCNDHNRAIRPGALEVPGNAADENCDGVREPFRKVGARATLVSLFGSAFIKLKSLLVTDLVKGDSVKLSCRGGGCTRSLKARIKIKRRTRVLTLTPRVRGARLKKGARLEVRVSHASYVTRIFRFTVKSYDDVPVRTELCQAPGAKRPGRC